MAKKKSKKSNDPAAKIAEKLRVSAGFELASLDASSTPGFKGKKVDAEETLAATAAEIDDLQERLYANGRDGDGPSVLLVVQGMDTSGKGGIMRHVVGSVDPQGVELTAFKSPSAEERRHPFLWRIRKALPRPGYIAVFDRSHYEDVLIVRVHNLVPATTWSRRYGQINTFEESVTKAGTRIIKIMLHIDADEQKARLTERLDRPDKWWKFNPGDLDERAYWDHYQEAYQVLLEKTSTDDAPWYVVPANKKWYARLAVQQILLTHLRDLDQAWPRAEFDVAEQQARLAKL
ncbi:PPK2 family polyphosphate kinase [Calidifontibacter terrae]